MKNKRTFLGAFLVVILLVGIFVTFGARDKKEPVINISNLKGVYDERELFDGTLLKNVTAWDDKDKDVTSSIVVESVLDVGDGNVKVTFVARDKANNIARETAIVGFMGEIKATEKETQNVALENYEKESAETMGETITAKEKNNTQARTEAKTQIRTTTQTKTEAHSMAQTEAKTEKKTDVVKTEKSSEETTSTKPKYPVVSMKANETTIAVGGNFVVSGFVSQITDDKDDTDELFKRLMINGQYDNKTPGDYPVYIYCRDSDGNTSQMMPFVIHVK